MSRTRYFVFRTVQTFVLLFVILTFLFFFFRMMPGDYTDLLRQAGVSQEATEAFAERWGLDQPLHVQYWKYVLAFATGDFGNSLQYRTPVWDHVNHRILNSFILVAPGITAGYIIGSLLGVIFGNNRGEKIEEYGIVPIIAVGTVPLFFLGLIFIMIFSSWLGLFPPSGMLPSGFAAEYDEWWRVYFTREFLWHFLLPFTAIAVRYSYLPTLIMRTSVVEVKGQGFAYFQRVSGLPKWNRLRHLGKHASLPVITMYPVSMTRAIGGLVLIEYVFNWPGIGFTLVEAVFARDIPVIQFVFFLVAAFVILGNYVVDIVYSIIDPRVTVEE